MIDLSLILRVVHIAATCISLGGLFYARMVLWPNLSQLEEPTRTTFLNTMIRRFAFIKWTGITVLAVTGIFQWLQIYPTIQQHNLYILYFIIKMIGAAGLLIITFLLALPDERLQGIQRYRGFWSGVNIVCGLLILIGAALMRSAH